MASETGNSRSERESRPIDRRIGLRAARLVALLAVVLMGATTWQGCAALRGEDRASSSFDGPPLRVGIAPNAPPVAFEVEGEIQGIEADLAALVGRSLKRPIEFVRFPFADLIPALERGDVDVLMSGLAVTPERAERVQFTTPYMDSGQLVLIRSRDIARFGRIQGMRRAGARVGYERGSTGERYVARSLRRSSSFAFEDIEAGLRSLRADRIDYFIHDAPTVWRIAGDPAQRDLHGLYRPLVKEKLAWAVRSDDQALRSVLDATIVHWQREGRIDPIVQRWIPVRVTLR